MSNKKKTPTVTEIIDVFDLCPAADEYKGMSVKAAWKSLSYEKMGEFFDEVFQAFPELFDKYRNRLSELEYKAREYLPTFSTEEKRKVLAALPPSKHHLIYFDPPNTLAPTDESKQRAVDSLRESIPWSEFIVDLRKAFDRVKNYKKVEGELDKIHATQLYEYLYALSDDLDSLRGFGHESICENISENWDKTTEKWLLHNRNILAEMSKLMKKYKEL